MHILDEDKNECIWVANGGYVQMCFSDYELVSFDQWLENVAKKKAEEIAKLRIEREREIIKEKRERAKQKRIEKLDKK